MARYVARSFWLWNTEVTWYCTLHVAVEQARHGQAGLRAWTRWRPCRRYKCVRPRPASRTGAQAAVAGAGGSRGADQDEHENGSTPQVAEARRLVGRPQHGHQQPAEPERRRERRSGGRRTATWPRANTNQAKTTKTASALTTRKAKNCGWLGQRQRRANQGGQRYQEQQRDGHTAEPDARQAAALDDDDGHEERRRPARRRSCAACARRRRCPAAWPPGRRSGAPRRSAAADRPPATARRSNARGSRRIPSRRLASCSVRAPASKRARPASSAAAIIPARTAATKAVSGAAMSSSGSTHCAPPTSANRLRAAESAGEMANTGRPAGQVLDRPCSTSTPAGGR